MSKCITAEHASEASYIVFGRVLISNFACFSEYPNFRRAKVSGHVLDFKFDGLCIFSVLISGSFKTFSSKII